jgi:hypothetical protein
LWKTEEGHGEAEGREKSKDGANAATQPALNPEAFQSGWSSAQKEMCGCATRLHQATTRIFVEALGENRGVGLNRRTCIEFEIAIRNVNNNVIPVIQIQQLGPVQTIH